MSDKPEKPRRRGFAKIIRHPDVFNTAPDAPSFGELAAPLVRRLLAKLAAQEAAEREAAEREAGEHE